MLLADQLVERLRPVAASDDGVGRVGGSLIADRDGEVSVIRQKSSLANDCKLQMQNANCKCRSLAIFNLHFPICIFQSRFRATAGERPPHKETQAYGCCVSTLTRFARPPLQRPLTGGRASLLSCTLAATCVVKGCPIRRPTPSRFRRRGLVRGTDCRGRIDRVRRQLTSNHSTGNLCHLPIAFSVN